MKSSTLWENLSCFPAQELKKNTDTTLTSRYSGQHLMDSQDLVIMWGFKLWACGRTHTGLTSQLPMRNDECGSNVTTSERSDCLSENNNGFSSWKRCFLSSLYCPEQEFDLPAWAAVGRSPSYCSSDSLKLAHDRRWHVQSTIFCTCSPFPNRF